MDQEPDVFSPFRLGQLDLANRIVMSPMTRDRADENLAPTDLTALYYAQRASAGIIITEGTPPDRLGQGYVRVPGIYTPEQVAGWSEVTKAVHANGGIIFQQIMYVGRVSHPDFLDGAVPVAPSAIPVGEGEVHTASGPKPFVKPRALDAHEIPDVIATYGRAARLSKEAGFDGVELHATSGYLPAQFLLSTINRREDDWGGNVAKRARFLLEAMDQLIAVWGASRVGVRIGPAFTFNDAHDPDPTETWEYVLPELAKRHIAYLHLINVPADWDVFGFVRKRWSGTLIANGGYTLERANADIAAGRADLVSFGKAFLANPDLPERLAKGAHLNEPDPRTFYVGGERGYTDYPTLSGEPSKHVMPRSG